MSLIHLTAAIPLLEMSILVMAFDPPSLLTSSSGEAAPCIVVITVRKL